MIDFVRNNLWGKNVIPDSERLIGETQYRDTGNKPGDNVVGRYKLGNRESG